MIPHHFNLIFHDLAVTLETLIFDGGRGKGHPSIGKSNGGKKPLHILTYREGKWMLAVADSVVAETEPHAHWIH